MKVYYNSACPLCDAGIESQRCRMAEHGTTPIEWIDVHANPGRVLEVGADLAQVRERLHVKTADGAVCVGADALGILFERTPGQQWLAKLLRHPLAHPFAVGAYNAFARCLYLWNRSRGRW